MKQKVSELTVDELADYLRIEADDITDTEEASLEAFLLAAKHYVQSYTGLDAEAIDAHPDIVPAVLCYAGDLYTNRDMVLNGSFSSNKTVENILAMYSINLL